MAKLTTAHSERAGVHAVGLIFHTKFGWFFREQKESDFGIDAEVEVADNGRPNGRLLALQIKSGPSFFRKRNSDYVYYGSMEHLDYWLDHCLPVFIILHNPENGLTLWQRVERHLVKVGKKGWSILVPATNTLDVESKKFLINGISNDPASVKRYRFASDRADMERYAGRTVFFQFDVWVNKSLSIRGIRVYFDDHEKAAPDEVVGVWAAIHTVHEVMAHFYPWLDYTYADYTDPDSQSGEVETHVFKVELNKAAKLFLKLERFFQKDTVVQNPPLPRRDEDDFYNLTDDEFDEWAFRRAVERDES